MMHAESKPRVVIPGDHPVQIGDSPQLDRLRKRADVVLHRNSPSDIDQQVQRVSEAEILINSRGHVRWDGATLARLSKLKMITTCSIGTDMIDLTAARQLGIVVCNIPGKTATVVAEHTLALIMAVAKRLAFQTSELKSGKWTRKNNLGLSGKTLGLIGAGNIGAEVARLARAIGMQVIAWTFHPSTERATALGVQFVQLDQLLETADVVTLHVKLTPESRHLLGAREFASMKEGSLLVNTARGEVIDNAALVDALQRGHLGGAALDVYDHEPLPADHPILSCEQVVLTPHAADQTPEGVELLNQGAVDNVLAYLDGQPQNVVE